MLLMNKIFFDQPVKNNSETYDNIPKIAIGQGYDYTTGCLLDYSYLKKYYKIIATHLSKLEAIDTDSKAIQQINFTGNLNRGQNLNDNTIFSITDEAKHTILDFSQGI